MILSVFRILIETSVKIEKTSPQKFLETFLVLETKSNDATQNFIAL